MKPLSPLLYLKNNVKSSLTVSCAMVIGVFLVSFYGLFSATTAEAALNGSLDLVKSYTMVYSSNNTPLPTAFLQELDAQKGVDPIPVLDDLSGGLRYNRGMASSGMEIFNLYASDVSALLKNYHMKLSAGRLPLDNANEILVTRGYALQNGLKVGDSVGTEVADKYQLPGRYTITGLLDGPLVFAVACQTGKVTREQLLRYSTVYNISHMTKREQNKLKNLLPKTAMTLDYSTFSNRIYGQLQMMQVLTVIITGMMIIILCIALGNLNVITFATRREEFAILSAIGYPKGRLVRKLWEETVLTCFLGYAAGSLLSPLVAWILNETVYDPQGAPLLLFNAQGTLSALAIPLFVSAFSILPGLLHNFSGHSDFSV